jgi:predicted negative regulator of RcsB-dependent stress response
MADASQKPHESEDPRNLDALSASEAPGVVDAIERNRTKILAGITIGAIVLCGVLVTGQLKKQKHLEASAAYTAAAGKADIAALDAVVVNFPGSIGAGNALLKKADLQVDQGKPEDARATLERFTAEFASHPRHPQGLFALANLFHVAGDREKAKAHYEKVIAAQKDGELTPLARIRLGDLALEAGDTKAADQFYQESYTLHPGNPFFEYAEKKISLLKVGNPPEVAKPAPPAPPAEPKADTPKADTPKADTPKADTPKADTPKADTPKADAPKADAPKPAVTTPAPTTPAAPAAPRTEAPKEQPKAVSPPVPAPAPAPQAPAPAPQTPKVEAPKPAAPAPAAPQAPKPAAPATGQPK